jgi:hypothetical protein
MKSIFNKIIIVSGCIGMTNAFGKLVSEMTVPELLTQQQHDYDILGQYWLDKEGNFRFGEKDATVRFSISPTMFDRMSVEQVKMNMESAIKLLKEHVEYENAIEPSLSDLKKVKDQIEAERNKLNNAVAKLAKILNKPIDKIVSLPDQNINALITQITDRTMRLDALDALASIKQLRPAFNIQTSAPTVAEMPDLSGGTSGAKKSGSGAGAAVAGAAAAAVSSFDIGNFVKAVGDATKYGTCGDRHYDIVEDSKGYRVTSKAG